MFYLVFLLNDMSFHKEYYLINLLLLLARFSIHKCRYGNYKPLFLILKSEVKQYLKSIYTLINKKAVKCINICKHFHVFMYFFFLCVCFIVILYLFLCVCSPPGYCKILNLSDSIKKIKIKKTYEGRHRHYVHFFYSLWSERVSNCQSHVISVNEASLRHNCFETFRNVNGSLLGSEWISCEIMRVHWDRPPAAKHWTSVWFWSDLRSVSSLTTLDFVLPLNFSSLLFTKQSEVAEFGITRLISFIRF